MVDVKARIEVIEGLSAHAGREGLVHWLGALKAAPRKVFVVHGEETSALDFVETVKAEKQWDAVALVFGESFEID
jgi:metallo-beta-lactamase family protein